jgi:hypothetical protein
VAASGVRRLQPSLIVLIVASALSVWPTSVDAVVPLARYQHWLGLLVVAVITASCLGAQYIARVAERRRIEGRARVPRLEAVLIGPGVAPRATVAPAPSSERTDDTEATELVG